MSIERASGPEIPADPLSIRAEKVLPEGDEYFDEFYDSFVDFHQEMAAEIATLFRGERNPWESVPAWHVLGKSGFRSDLAQPISPEVKDFIERKIEHFLDVWESKNDFSGHS